MFPNLLNQNKEEVERLKKQIAELEGKIQNSTETFEPEKEIFSWEAPSRIFVQRDRKWFYQLTGIFALCMVFAAIFQRIEIIIMLAMLLLLTYVLSTIPPEIVKHSITNKGFKSIGNMYSWSSLKHYFFSKKDGVLLLNIDTDKTFPSRLVILVPEEINPREIDDLLARRIPRADIDPTKQGRISKITDGEIL